MSASPRSRGAARFTFKVMADASSSSPPRGGARPCGWAAPAQPGVSGSVLSRIENGAAEREDPQHVGEADAGNGPILDDILPCGGKPSGSTVTRRAPPRDRTRCLTRVRLVHAVVR